jgi:hypothetical protein
MGGIARLIVCTLGVEKARANCSGMPFGAVLSLSFEATLRYFTRFFAIFWLCLVDFLLNKIIVEERVPLFWPFSPIYKVRTTMEKQARHCFVLIVSCFCFPGFLCW